jgi:hypothetical protein
MASECLGIEPIEIATGYCANVSKPQLLAWMQIAASSPRS